MNSMNILNHQIFSSWIKTEEFLKICGKKSGKDKEFLTDFGPTQTSILRLKTILILTKKKSSLKIFLKIKFITKKLISMKPNKNKDSF